MDFINIFTDAKSALIFFGVALALVEILLGIIVLFLGVLGFLGWRGVKSLQKEATEKAVAEAKKRVTEIAKDFLNGDDFRAMVSEATKNQGIHPDLPTETLKSVDQISDKPKE